ncbi:MAG: diacylglycerol/lipid kinase family protein [Bacillota bacterium]
MPNKIAAIVNPVSANGKTALHWPSYEKFFRENNINMEVFLSRYAGDAVEISRQAVKNGYKKIMAVGGDGTVNEVINGFFQEDSLIDDDIKLIVFSQGTGCDFNRNFQFGRKPDDIVHIINSNNFRKIDIGHVKYINHSGVEEERYFVNLSDTGIGAATARLVNQSSKVFGGFITYLLGVFRILISYKNREIKVVIDGEEKYRQLINSVIIANGKYFGGGIKIAPRAELDNGFFNIVVLKNFSKIGIVLNLVKAYKGTHISHKLVESIKGKEIAISVVDGGISELEIDGESVGILPARFKILKSKLSIMV